MTTHSFKLILSGVDKLTDAMADALFEAGCDDASPSSCNGVVALHFDREAESMVVAIGSAMIDVDRAGYTVARLERVAPEGEPIHRPDTP